MPTGNEAITVVLNAPATWWFNWRYLTHLKDEALSPMAYVMERLPVADIRADVYGEVAAASANARTVAESLSSINDWLRHEFGLSKSSQTLSRAHNLAVEEFIDAVRAAFPRNRKWSASEIARLKQEHAETLVPARLAAERTLELERQFSDLVNAAYGLTREEIALMWRTAPPRMPLDPEDELRRLA